MSDPVKVWRVRDGSIPLDHPILVGVLNATPDSFSDGGVYLAPDAARRHADQLVEEGADVIDIGGESTRPQGAQRVPEEQERARVVPIVDWLQRTHPKLPISVDTTKASVAQAAFDVGAHIVNDVSGGRLDMHMCDVVAAARGAIIMMHSRGGVETMATYDHAVYGDDPVPDIMHELSASAMRAEEAGIPRDAIVLDPGIGFAKRTEHSLAVLRRLDRICSLGYPVMVGASRKRVVGELAGVADPRLRLAGSLGAHVAALARGARLFRVHDVKAHREALAVAWAIVGSKGSDPLDPPLTNWPVC